MPSPQCITSASPVSVECVVKETCRDAVVFFKSQCHVCKKTDTAVKQLFVVAEYISPKEV